MAQLKSRGDGHQVDATHFFPNLRSFALHAEKIPCVEKFAGNGLSSNMCSICRHANVIRNLDICSYLPTSLSERCTSSAAVLTAPLLFALWAAIGGFCRSFGRSFGCLLRGASGTAAPPYAQEANSFSRRSSRSGRPGAPPNFAMAGPICIDSQTRANLRDKACKEPTYVCGVAVWDYPEKRFLIHMSTRWLPNAGWQWLAVKRSQTE